MAAETTRQKVTGWLQNDVFPYIGKAPVSTLKPRDVLVCVQRMEARDVHESAHRVKQIIGQVLRFAVATGLAKRDVTPDLKGALTVPAKRHYAAIIDPEPAGELLRAIWGYHGHPHAAAAHKLSVLLFVRPGELRAAEWREIDPEDSVWRIAAAKMRMRHGHLVPLTKQAVDILRGLHRMTGDGRREVRFPQHPIRRPLYEKKYRQRGAARRDMGYAKKVMTAHSFRAMARTMLDEILEERVDLIEHQLAHAVIDPNGCAYNRTANVCQLRCRRQWQVRWRPTQPGARSTGSYSAHAAW